MINTVKHLCYVLKTSATELEFVIKNIDKYYYEKAEVKMKKDGTPKLDKDGTKKRVLNPSINTLKHLQKMLLQNILYKIELPDYIYGATKGRDNVMNGKRHQGNKFIFTTDLKDFFPTISHKMVFDMFRLNNFSPTVSRVLTQLTTYKGHLPQGAPTSPVMANLVFLKTGDKLNKLSKANKITFTTFIDDLTFSSKSDFKPLAQLFIEIIRKDRYLLSHNKTNYKTKNPIVTGVIVKNNNVSLTKAFKEKLANPKGLTKAQVKGLKQYESKVHAANT